VPSPIRIVIAGEYPIFRHGLRRLLDSESRFTIAGEDADGSSVDALVRDLDPDVVLLGCTPSKRPVAETIRALAATGARAQIILLSEKVDTAEVTQGLALGVRGVVLKDAAPEILFAAIHHVMTGSIWLGHEPAQRVDTGLKQLTAARRRSRAFGLTPREVEIIRAVVSGCSNREIAERSSISENTVKSHLTHIFNKSGASSRVELALFASHHRLLDGV
jgi:two-component system nitrate/nitrite response regulator NarL